MRVSVSSRPANTWYETWLDGKKISKVFFADEELGVVVRAVQDEQGRVIIEGDCVKRELEFGCVAIINPRLLPVPVRPRMFTLEEICRIFNVPVEALAGRIPLFDKYSEEYAKELLRDLA